MENEFKQSRSVLKCTEDEVDSLLSRMTQMVEHLWSIRCALQQRKEEVEPLTWRISKMEHSHHQHARKSEMKGHLNSIRSDLKSKEEEMISLLWRMGQMKGRLNCIRSDLKIKVDQVVSLRQRSAPKHGERREAFSDRMTEMKGHLCNIRSDLTQKEEEVKSLSDRMGKMERELHHTRSDLTQKEEEVKSLSLRVKAMEDSDQQQNQSLRSYLELKEEEVKSLLHRMGQMENNARSALEEKDKELRSFKDRVAGDVALSMKTGKRLVSMNSPVSRSRLKEMYEELWSQWPKIKNDLISEQSLESVTKLIQEKFNEAILDMEKKKQQIVEVFVLDDLSRGSASEKVQQYQQSTCQNLQLALYHGRKEDADLKPPSTGYEGGKPQDVKEYWASKCYWLGCLMALNNPPLQPDWKNHDPQMDPWDFFPRNLTAASGK